MDVTARKEMELELERRVAERTAELSRVNEQLTQEIAERKQIEQSLRHSEESYRLHFENVSDVVCAMDREFRITSISPSVFAAIGYRPEEITGKRFDELGLLDPADLPRAIEISLRVLGGERVTSEYTIRHRDGREVFFEMNSSPLVRDGQVVGGLVVARDITARRLAELELHRSEERYRLHFDNVSDIVCSVDLDLIITSISPSLERVLGFRQADAVGKPFGSVGTMVEPLASQVRDAARRALAGERVTIECDLRARDGRSVAHELGLSPVRQDGRITGAVIVGRDITERKRAEDALREHLHLLQTLLDAIPHPIYYKDTNHRYLGCNEAFCRSSSLSRDQIVGRTVLEIDPTADSSYHHQVDSELFQDRQTKTYEHAGIYPNDKDRFMIFRKAPFYDAAGNLAGLVGTCTDITDRKRAEDELRRSEAKIRAILAAIPDQIVRLRRDGCYLEVFNPPGHVSLLAPQHANRLNARDVLPKHLADRLFESIERAFATGQLQAVEYEVTLPDGQVRQREARFVVSGLDEVLVLARDITDRKKAENELRRSEARNRAIINVIPDRMYSLTRSGVYKELICAGAVEAFRPWVEYKGATYRQIVSPGLADRIDQAVDKAFQTGLAQTVEYELNDPDRAPRRWREARYVVSGQDELICLIRDITERKTAEAQLLEYQERLRSMASQLSLTEERERRQIAVELHDQIGQTLALAKIKLGLVSQLLAPLPAEGGAVLGEATDLIEQSLADSRSLIFQLSPPILYELGFEPAIEWLADQVESKYGVRIEIEDDGRPKPMNDDIRVVMFQATRELLVNAAKHSRANRIRVTIARLSPAHSTARGGPGSRRRSKDGTGDAGSAVSQIRVEVSDNGVGFDTGPAGPAGSTAARESKGSRGGFGLFSLRERLTPLGGSLLIDSAPGKGCRASLLAPVKSE